MITSWYMLYYNGQAWPLISWWFKHWFERKKNVREEQKELACSKMEWDVDISWEVLEELWRINRRFQVCSCDTPIVPIEHTLKLFVILFVHIDCLFFKTYGCFTVNVAFNI